MKGIKSKYLLYTFPVVYILIDVLLRSTLLKLYSIKQIGFYILSIAVFFLFYLVSCAILNRIRKRKFLFHLLLLGFCIYLVGSIIGSYIFYYFNGFYPNYYTIEYFKNEPTSAFVLLKDTIKMQDIVMFFLGFIALFWWFKRLHQREIVWSKPKLLAPILVLYFGLVTFLIVKVKKYDQCYIVDTNFSSVIVRHIVNYESNRQFKGKGLENRTPYLLPKFKEEKDFNVLVIVLESLRNQNLQVYGYHRKTTPNLAKLKKEEKEGLFIFKHPYTVSSTTMLAVPSVLTGIGPFQDKEIFYSQPFLWDFGNMLNYRTFFVSSHSLKWYRFDRFYSTARLNHIWYKERSGKPFFNDLGIDDQYTIAHLKKMINLSSKRNFFGVVQLNSTHYPYKIPQNKAKWSGAFVDEYDNSILYQDYVLGQLFDDLKRTGKLKNTVIVIASDHGESLKDHNNIGHVDSYYAETISVPLMIYLPKSVRKKLNLTQFKKNLTATTSTIDIAPTLMELMGLSEKKELAKIKANYTGFSLFQAIPKNRKIITMNNNETAKFKVGISVIGDGLHYIHRMNIVPNRAELYNIKKDPKESKNILQNYPSKKLKSYLSCMEQYEICKKYLP